MASSDVNQSPRFALFGMLGAGNLGNEGSLDAFMRYLRAARPHAQVECIAYDPRKVTAEHGIAAIPMERAGRPASPVRPPLVLRALRRLLCDVPAEIAMWIRTIVRMRKFDALVVPGTGILDDFGVNPSGLPYALFKWCLAARLVRTPVVFLSVGAGPIHHPRSRWFMKAAARLATYRSYRDEESKQFMESIGFRTGEDPVFPDIVFSLPSAPVPPADASTGGPRVIGLGVMTYYGWSNRHRDGELVYRKYVSDLTDFLVWLLDQRYEVRLLIGKGTDQKAAEEIQTGAARVRPDLAHRMLRFDPIRSLHDVMHQAAASDIVVATRFHNLVSALVQAKPVLSLGYAEKNEALMRAMGLSAFCQHVEHIDHARLRQQFTELAADWLVHRDRIRTISRTFHERSHAQLAHVFGMTAVSSTIAEPVVHCSTP